MRVCIDCRVLNAITDATGRQDLGRFGKCSYPIQGGPSKGFHQILIAPNDIPKSAFSYHNHKYEYTRMTFVLTSGPAIFQRLMEIIFKDAKSFTHVYIDDIIIFSEAWMEHCEHLAIVLELLGKAELTVNVKKCQFGMGLFEFLGHMVGNGLSSPSQAKVQDIKNYYESTTKLKIRAFLGIISSTFLT